MIKKPVPLMEILSALRRARRALAAAERRSYCIEPLDDLIEFLIEQEIEDQQSVHTGARPDPRDPDYSRKGIFIHHNCYRCKSGELSCIAGNPSKCPYPKARND